MHRKRPPPTDTLNASVYLLHRTPRPADIVLAPNLALHPLLLVRRPLYTRYLHTPLITGHYPSPPSPSVLLCLPVHLQSTGAARTTCGTPPSHHPGARACSGLAARAEERRKVVLSRCKGGRSSQDFWFFLFGGLLQSRQWDGAGARGYAGCKMARGHG